MNFKSYMMITLLASPLTSLHAGNSLWFIEKLHQLKTQILQNTAAIKQLTDASETNINTISAQLAEIKGILTTQNKLPRYPFWKKGMILLTGIAIGGATTEFYRNDSLSLKNFNEFNEWMKQRPSTRFTEQEPENPANDSGNQQ